MTAQSAEQTLVLIKPDGLKKSLTGNILSKLSETRLIIIGSRVVRVSEDLARNHYRHLVDKPFFGELLDYIQGKPYGKDYERVMALVYRGPDAINKVRQMAGATNPEEADSVSIRGSYGRITTKGIFENVIHASADAADAEREIKLWFKPAELALAPWPTKTVKSEPHDHVVWA
jgi:nucleoside-diphosphate kinase